MANYSLVAGAQFRPFSYQELMAPIVRMNEVQGQLEEQYDALSAQADVLEAMGKNDRDKGVYNQYKAFSDALRAEADNLYRNGLTSDSRLRLSEMKRRYSKEIVPILNAWAKRKQEADVQMKAQMADPTLMFTRNANTTSLQSYIDNPEGGFTTISGKNIAAQVGTGAAALAEEIRMNPNGETATRLKHLDPFTYETIVKRGFTSAEIADWQNRPALRNIVENVLAANGVTRDNLGDRFDSIYSQSLGYAVPALNQAVGKTTVGTMADYYKQKMLDFNLDERKADNTSRRKIAEEQAKNGGVGDAPIVTSMAVGLTPTEQYNADNLRVLETLKGGKDGLKSSYFGRTFGQVNPMEVYDEYKKALNKHTRTVSAKEARERGIYGTALYKASVTGNPNPIREIDYESAKKEVLDKYKKYGVTDILSDEQYNALKNIGYSAKNGISSTRHSALIDAFNKTVEQKSRYSTNMSGYDYFDDEVRRNMRSRDKYGKFVNTSWSINDDGTLGSPERLKDLDLYTDKNKDGNKIEDVQYDPAFRGKIVIQLTDGSLHVIDPSVFNSNMANRLAEWETANNGAPMPPQAITMLLTKDLNEYNMVKSKSSSKAE